MALEPRTGKVLWKTNKSFISGYGEPAWRGGRLYFIDDQDLICASATDGAELWRQRVGNWFHTVSLGTDCLTGRGYSGFASRWNLVDGKPVEPKGKRILVGGPDHACGPVLLTAGGVSVAVTVSGLYLRDVKTGEILWSSLGFAPRACSSPAAANGRIFYNPQCDAMIFCFEPASGGP